jgi:hypothetical protein
MISFTEIPVNRFRPSLTVDDLDFLDQSIAEEEFFGGWAEDDKPEPEHDNEKDCSKARFLMLRAVTT